MGRVTIINTEGREERRLLAHNSVGRHPNNTLQVLDRIVSKTHCHIDLENGRYILRDLGSLNGTYVNGERVKEQPLKDGDEITMGNTVLIFTSEAVPSAPATVSEPSLSFSDVGHTRVTISEEGVESHIRTKLAMMQEQTFLPERLLGREGDVRRDYEKLRVSFEVIKAIGNELDIDKVLQKILDCAFQLLSADRGIILLYDERGQLSPRCVHYRNPVEGQEMRLSTTIVSAVLRDKAAVLSSDAMIDARFQAAQSIIMQGIRSSMAVPLLHGEDVFGIILLDSQVAANAFTEKDLMIFQSMANQAAIAVQNGLFARKLQVEAITRERFQRLLSPAIADQVISGQVEVKKGGELRHTTFLFTDIRGFTRMSETSSPQNIVDMLNDYFERMVEIIFKYDGTLDKFVGDEIMALYGAPVHRPDDPIRAVATALEMMEELQLFNEYRERHGLERIEIGIGINSGEVIAGYLGSSKSLDYTVIGDAVNVGSRLCSIAQAGQIIVSQATFELVKHAFEAIELPPTQVKGKARPMTIYQVTGAKGGVSWTDVTDPQKTDPKQS